MATGTLISIQWGVNKPGSNLMDHTGLPALKAHGGRVDGTLACTFVTLTFNTMSAHNRFSRDVSSGK